jgi:hypothetical protein
VEVQVTTDILNVINQLPDRKYNNMADVEKSIGEIYKLIQNMHITKEYRGAEKCNQ